MPRHLQVILKLNLIILFYSSGNNPFVFRCCMNAFLMIRGLATIVSRSIDELITATSACQGAATTCYVALHPQVKGVSGKYFDSSNLATPSSKALDMDLAKKLWDFSMELNG